jgi:hypothetical protein
MARAHELSKEAEKARTEFIKEFIEDRLEGANRDKNSVVSESENLGPPEEKTPGGKERV